MTMLRKYSPQWDSLAKIVVENLEWKEKFNADETNFVAQNQIKIFIFFTAHSQYYVTIK